MTDLRAAARGKPCTFRWPGVCNFDPETSVLCHAKTGGMSRKCPDTAAFIGCMACHDLYDRRDSRWAEIGTEALDARALRAVIETHEIWAREGLLDAAKPPPVKRKPVRKSNAPKRKIQSRVFDKTKTRTLKGEVVGPMTEIEDVQRAKGARDRWVRIEHGEVVALRLSMRSPGPGWENIGPPGTPEPLYEPPAPGWWILPGAVAGIVLVVAALVWGMT